MEKRAVREGRRTRVVDPRRWQERPLLAAGLQALLVLVPLALGALTAVAGHAWLPIEGLAGVPSWVVAAAVAAAVVGLVRPLTRRLMPLAWLLRLGMLFPERAPSRLRLARQASRLRRVEDGFPRADVDVHDGAQRIAELVLTLVAALTAHDRRTRGHAERVRIFTDLLALQMGLPQEDRDRLRWAALLHDIGKLEVPERILNRAGKPTGEDWDRIKQHPAVGDRLLAPLRPWLGRWADTALHHHERWDGTGYPAGLAGTDICLGGRIVAVTDAYEVMTAPRSYRRPVAAADARAELVKDAGAQFDPAVVRAFLLIPLPRLRWALGPLAGIGQLPLARDVAHVAHAAHAGSNVTVRASQPVATPTE